jgi:hypothetical protein
MNSARAFGPDVVSFLIPQVSTKKKIENNTEVHSALQVTSFSPHHWGMLSCGCLPFFAYFYQRNAKLTHSRFNYSILGGPYRGIGGCDHNLLLVSYSSPSKAEGRTNLKLFGVHQSESCRYVCSQS